ncbi:MAG: endo-1,4-beta-xylanase [Anaerolineae bacterium]|nr:endo-1,4-beta-xylanase [Anaerolineae bacterium]
MNEQNGAMQEILSSAPQRIRQHRTAEVELCLVDERGAPLPGAQVRVQLARHAFKLGCNAFLIDGVADEALQRGYRERFVSLLNYATLPFYWGYYERTKGETQEQRLLDMAGWCAHQQIATKGHPLAWHEVFPQWAHACADDKVVARLEKRVHEIVSRFRGKVDIWDVVNEATVSHRFDNAIGRWVAAQGAAACVEKVMRWAWEANPEATLLYNDFNLAPEFETLVADLLDRGVPLDAIGIQSHMHKGAWPLEKAWQACETYARFGLPLHWTELTVLSGALKAADDNDWHFRHTDWPSTEAGERAQAEYGAALYTLLFSHPAVEAVTWWDFSDYASWQGAPSGLLRVDMSPKPLYERLHQLAWEEWRTDVQATSDEGGRIRLRCFFGQHQVEGRTAGGASLAGMFECEREGAKSLEIVLRRA